MDQPARLRFVPGSRRRRGFLLLEATLTVTVLAVGLVFIARGLGNSLKALSVLERSETLRHLADSQLAALEISAQHGQPLAREGSCDTAQPGCRWMLRDAEASSPDIPERLRPSVRLVTLTVTGEQPGSAEVRLQTLWPSEWLQ